MLKDRRIGIRACTTTELTAAIHASHEGIDGYFRRACMGGALLAIHMFKT